jgi:methionyl-tRNA formyltransferase
MHNIPCGTCIQDKKSLKITCTDGFIQVLEIQEDARKKMDIQSFVNGSQLDGKMTESC